MDKVLRGLLTTLFFLFFTIQFYLTLFGGFFWPFASHRLFSQLPVNPKPIVQAILEDSQGNILCVHPGKVIPIEYSRCSGLVRNLSANGTAKQQQAFIDYLLTRLNNGAWTPFDEMFLPAKSPSNAPFTALRFETHVVEFRERLYPDSLKVVQRSPLFP